MDLYSDYFCQNCAIEYVYVDTWIVVYRLICDWSCRVIHVDCDAFCLDSHAHNVV